jgi:hypothetical protein
MLKIISDENKKEIIKLISCKNNITDGLSQSNNKIVLYWITISSSFLIPIFFYSAVKSLVIISICVVISLLTIVVTAKGLIREFALKSIYKRIKSEDEEINRLYNEINSKTDLTRYYDFKRQLTDLISAPSCPHLKGKYKKYFNSITSKIKKLEIEKRFLELKQLANQKLRASEEKLTKRFVEHPLNQTKNILELNIEILTQRRRNLQEQWDDAYNKFSWWQKLNCEKPDFSELDDQIKKFERTLRKLENKHSEDYDQLRLKYEKARELSEKRINESYKKISRYLKENTDPKESVDKLLSAAILCSGLSIPFSILDDLNRADQIYDALRRVNGNFADLSNTEIFWESLWMPEESIQGLVNLTKGAYFEQLVAEDTGGKLFENFNHEDTDIITNGVEYQLKATDSVDYINSVDEDIPVIATSEVAEATGSIDSGVLNEDLTNYVELVLDGPVIDVLDTAVDSILSGLGGLGLFATIQGINHAAKKYNSGGDGVEAVFEGAGIAIVGTARSMVNTAEFVYKAVTCRPMRFIGRQGLKVLKKADQKLFE